MFDSIDSEKIKSLFAFYFTVSGLLGALGEEYNNGKADLYCIVHKYPKLYKEIRAQASKDVLFAVKKS